MDLELQGDRRLLTPGVELATYRTLQHALLAVGGATTITLRYLRDSLELEVTGTPTDRDGAELAFAAERERVVAQGGSFSSNDPAGRRVLRATLPFAIAHA